VLAQNERHFSSSNCKLQTASCKLQTATRHKERLDLHPSIAQAALSTPAQLGSLLWAINHGHLLGQEAQKAAKLQGRKAASAKTERLSQKRMPNKVSK